MTTLGQGQMAGRIALITGASRGIGRAVALRYAAEGAHLVLVARTQGALEELDDEIRKAGATATLLPLDITDFDALDRMGAALFERFKRLDVLVGNAGMLGRQGPIAHLDPRIWDQTMAINVTANWRLIRSCDPLLRASQAGRAIFVTSGVTKSPRPYTSVYAVSKAALEMLVRLYAAEVAMTPIRVNLLNPGATRTRMREEFFPGEDPMTVKAPESITDHFVRLALASCTAHGELVDC